VSQVTIEKVKLIEAYWLLCKDNLPIKAP